MPITLGLLLAVLAFLLGAILVYAWLNKQQFQQEKQRQQEHQDYLRLQNEQVLRLREQLAAAQEKNHQERKQFTEQIALLQSARNDLTKEFENLANKIFENKQQQFTRQSQQVLDSTLNPLKSQLQDFRKKIEDAYDKENSERNRLAGQIIELQKQAQKIGEDAVNLAQALKSNHKFQGNWGEMVLERLLEDCGLQKGREYDTQINFTLHDGSRLIPDVIVHLPDNKDIVIDAKCSLVDYEKYCSTEDETEKAQHLHNYINALRNQIKSLSIKNYESLEGIKALDFVFIFIPIEVAFMLALQNEPALYKEAYERRIVLVSPTTLLATLRTVDNIWRYEKQNKHAERIAKEAGALHDQFVLLLESMDAIGYSLDKAQESYIKARERMQTGRGNLVKRVDDIRRLGAKTKKLISAEILDDVTDSDDLFNDTDLRE